MANRLPQRQHARPKTREPRKKHRELYGTERWKVMSERYRRENPICVECQKEGRINDKELEVDHITPHRGDAALFYDWRNLQSLCDTHHNQKTAIGQ